jgi:hypothetical protein
VNLEECVANTTTGKMSDLSFEGKAVENNQQENRSNDED